MAKTLKLKQWLTIPEAFNHIAPIFDDEIELSDIYRFILDGHLTLSVNFVNHAYGREGEYVPYDEWINNDKYYRPMMLPFEDKITNVLIGENLGDFAFVPFENSRINNISGIWDLVISGNGQLEIEHIYYEMVAGVASELINLRGTYFKQENKGFELMAPFHKNEKAFKDARAIKINAGAKLRDEKFDFYNLDNWFPCPNIPNNAIHCIKTSELERFIKAQTETPETQEPKELTTRERSTYQNIIKSLLHELKEKGVSETAFANIITTNSELLGEPVPQSTAYKKLNELKK